MEPYWDKAILINASRTECGNISFSIVMGLTGPILVMSIGDERVVVASRWQDYTTDHTKQIVDALAEGVQALKDRVPR